MFTSFKKSLLKTSEKFTSSISDFLGLSALTSEEYKKLEESLLRSDLGRIATNRLLDRIKMGMKANKYYKEGSEDIRNLEEILKSEMIEILKDGKDGNPNLAFRGKKPQVVLICGVNGAGKTTTVGKLANIFSQNRRVAVVAGDTVRAAAVDQLHVWCDRANVPIVADESAEAAFSLSLKKRKDLIIVDTAGRLQANTENMKELEELGKFIGKKKKGAPDETWLVLDGTTGSNALDQALVFQKHVPLTGIIITKLDGTAKGGSVIRIALETSLPILYVGVGESLEDLREFNPSDFVDAILAQGRKENVLEKRDQEFDSL